MFPAKLAFLLCVFVPCFNKVRGQQTNTIIFNYNNTYKYNELYTVTVNKFTEYIMEFAGDAQVYDTPARVTVASDFANRTYPLFVTARQQKGIFSWQLPQIVQTANTTEQITNISRTLCPHNNLFDEHQDSCDISNQNTPILHLTSSSPDDIQVTIQVETVTDFYIKLNSLTNLTVTPSQPRYYFYPFKQEPRNVIDLESQAVKRKDVCSQELQDGERKLLKQFDVRQKEMEDRKSWFWRPKSVILMIESDDDVCALVSIQKFSCPVFDNERDILYDGYYLTMTRRGGITLTQESFPVGFYIVFIVKTSDEDCLSTTETSANVSSSTATYFKWGASETVEVEINESRVKTFRFQVIETISYQEYMIAAGAALAFFLSFYLAYFISICVSARARRTIEDVVSSEEGNQPSPPVPRDDSGGTSYRRRRYGGETRGDSGRGDSTADPLRVNDDGAHMSSSDTESECSILNDADPLSPTYTPGRLCLASLARKRGRVLAARSKSYLWHVLTVSVFYTLPVIQLVVTYQRLLNQSGNQDLCYYNFFCAHPLSALSDFNHVFSNLGYVMLGSLFLLQVWTRHRRHRASTAQEKELGIPQHFGILYAMGIALVSEGILSAAYHVCPNSMNFQFDTSFMYVTGVLCMVKLYQNRHPDINARAHATFPALALIIFIGLVGVLNANLYFWVGFTILHLTTCLIMTFQIYYLGRFKFDGGTLSRAARQFSSRPLHAVTPTHAARCVLLIVANVANWALAGYGMAQHSRDFASHLLLVIMSNLFLYTLFYIIMKLSYRERITWYSWVFIALTYSTWFGSSYFFIDQSTNWALTPAQSRRSNRVCSLLQLYDSHDIWHFLSATAMFYSFNMYLTIDDPLQHEARTNIVVF